MNLSKKQKVEAGRELAKRFKSASHLYFTQYQGLKFGELAELRKKLKPLACRYQVVKNTLVAHALKDAGIAGAADALLKGPLGLVVGEGQDPVAAAKVLAGFSKEFSALKIKAGWVESRWLGAQECTYLSTLGTRAELLGSVAGAMYGAMAQGAGLLRAPLMQMALLLKSLVDKKTGEVPAAA